MPVSIIPVNGSLNIDDSYDIVKKGDLVDSLNTTTISDIQAYRGVRVSVNGNRIFSPVGYALPAGINYSIGNVSDPVKNRVIDFLWNSNGYHQIREFDFTNNVINVLLQDNAPQTNYDVVLNFSQDPITSAFIIHRDSTVGDLLFWIDNNGLRELNIDKARAGSGAYAILYYDDLFLGKIPPLFPPVCSYGNDPSFKSNNLRSKLFQFAYRFVYDDYSKSTLSGWSQVPIPTGSVDPSVDTVVTNNNVINIQIQTGGNLVTYIELIGRTSIGDGNWSNPYLIERIDRSLISPNSTYVYKFYNNANYPVVNLQEAYRLFSNIPQQANAMTLINNSVILVGGIKEGYDYTDVTPNVTVVGSSYQYVFNNQPPVPITNTDVNITGNISGSESVAFTAQYVGSTQIVGTCYVTAYVNIHIHLPFGRSTYRHYTINFALTSGQTSQTVNIATGHKLVGYNTFGIDSYTVNGQKANPSGVFFSFPAFDWGSSYRLGIVYYDKLGRTNTVYTGDSFIANCPDLNIIKPVSGPVTEYIPKIVTSIYHQPPVWAYSYQWVITKNVTAEWFLYWKYVQYFSDSKYYYLDISNLYYYGTNVNISTNLKYDFVQGDRVRIYGLSLFTRQYVLIGDYTIFGLEDNPTAGNGNFITAIQITNPGFGYTSAPSVQITGGGGSGATAVATVQNGQVVKIDVTNPGTGYTSAPTVQITGGGGSGATAVAVAGYWPGTFIKIANNGMLTTFMDYIIKIYRPAKKDVNDTQVYYEIGEAYPIINPGQANRYHAGKDQNQTSTQPAVTTITNGDVFFTTYNIPSSVYNIPTTYFDPVGLMALNYSDNFPSAQPSFGRALAVFRDAKSQFYPSLVRWSGPYVSDTKINELNIFDDANQDEYNVAFGQIRRIIDRGSFVRIFQEKKVGYVPVAQQVIKTTTGGDILSESERIVGKIQYYVADYGLSGNSTSLASGYVADYFCDIDKGVCVRVSHNGMDAISKLYKCDTFFNSVLKYYRDSVLSSMSPDPSNPYQPIPKIIGLYDFYKDEYIIMLQPINNWHNAILSINQPGYCIGFNESKNGFESFYSFIGEGGGFVNNVLYTFLNGSLYTHDNSANPCNFYGVQYDCYVQAVDNENLLVDKTYISLQEVSNAVWYADMVKTSLNQQSQIPASSFKILEGKASSNFYRDSLSTGGLVNGTTLKGKWITIRVRNTPSGGVSYITALMIRYIVYP